MVLVPRIAKVALVSWGVGGLATPVFAHRVVINTRTTLVQRRADMGERVIEEILSQVDVPL